MKGLDAVRQGGIVAFITSQGVMNVPQYEPQRRWLMENADLVSAIRLPNNLFTEIANTEVGSDLIILQKHIGKGKLSDEENSFLKGYVTAFGTTDNQYYQTGERIIHTKGYLDTDPYGKPAMIYIHEGGVQGIAADLQKMLSEDFSLRLDEKLFQKYANQSEIRENINSTKANNPINQLHTTIAHHGRKKMN